MKSQATMKNQTFIRATVILIIAGFATRFLGFVYRIFLSNVIGAEGMGVYQLVMPVYSLLFLTLTSGMSIAVSRMVAGELAHGNFRNVSRITRVAFITISLIGLAVSGLMLIFADTIATKILGESRTYYSLLVLVPCIPAVAAASALKGTFYGMQNMVPTAVSAIGEQITKMVIVMFFISKVLDRGIDYVCAMAVFGSAMGEIANMAILIVFYKFGNVRYSKDQLARSRVLRKRKILWEIIRVSVPISFNRLIISAMSAVEMILIPGRLLAGGLDYTTAMEEYGKLTGMVSPLIFFPSLITSALATALVPVVSEALSLKSFRTLNHRISKSIQWTFVIGFLFSVMFMSFPNEIGNLIYRGFNVGNMLYMMAFSCVFVYLNQTTMGIMNGLGKQRDVLNNSVISQIIRIGFVYFYVPVAGIRGYVIGIVISTLVDCLLNFRVIIRTTGMAIHIRNWVLKPLLVSVVLILVSRYFIPLYNWIGMSSPWSTILAVVTQFALGVGLLILIGALNGSELFHLVRNTMVRG